MQNFVQLLVAGGMLVPIVLIISVAIAAAVWSSKQEQKRNAAMQAVATELGLPFFVQGDAAVMSQFSHFELFSLGRDKQTANMIHGDTADVDMAIFDYRYTTGHGKSRRTPRQTVISFCSPLLSLPSFALRPENFADRIGQWLGFADFDFESHPVFSKAYVLRGQDEAAVRALFDANVLAFFESLTGICVEGAGDRLICYRSQMRVEPQNIRALMDEGFRIYMLFRSRAMSPPGSPFAPEEE